MLPRSVRVSSCPLLAIGALWVGGAAAAPSEGPSAPPPAPAPGAPADRDSPPEPGAEHSTRERATEQERATGAEGGRPAAVSGEQEERAARYEQALAVTRRDERGPLGATELDALVRSAERLLIAGRRDEAIAQLSVVVGSQRFAAVAALPEARAARMLLAEAAAEAGAHDIAVHHLRYLMTTATDVWSRKAVAKLVDLGLASGDLPRFAEILRDAAPVGSQSIEGDLAYFRGFVLEGAGDFAGALRKYESVAPLSRYWAQATYRAGLLHVRERRYQQGEHAFCEIADPTKTPKLAPVYGGREFFAIRDLSRLALGRIAHEQFRFDDARYYYHQVPADSERLPEALYESATSRYEAKDYEGARSLLDELARVSSRNAYHDEAQLLNAYVDLALCRFPQADARLTGFEEQFSSALDALRGLLAEVTVERDPATPLLEADLGEGFGLPPRVAAQVQALIRTDPGNAALARAIADVDRQIDGARLAQSQAGELIAQLRAGDAAKARPREATADSDRDKLSRLAQQTASLRRMLREVSAGAPDARAAVSAIFVELNAVEAQADQLRRAQPSPAPEGGEDESDPLLALLVEERRDAGALSSALREVKAELVGRRRLHVVAALRRLELRLTRLLRRAKAGRIETVLGTKRALELEVEALSQGLLPPGAIDSLDAARYLQDDEEFWPVDGEDWADEYIGGEGL